MAASIRTKPLRAGDKVRATRDLKGVPKGTQGVIKVIDGLAFPRYWVKWDNAVWMGSLLDRDLVRASEWDEFEREQAKAASRPVAVAARAAPAAAVEDAPAPKTGGVPAHLLERSQAARAKKAVDPA